MSVNKKDRRAPDKPKIAWVRISTFGRYKVRCEYPALTPEEQRQREGAFVFILFHIVLRRKTEEYLRKKKNASPKKH